MAQLNYARTNYLSTNNITGKKIRFSIVRYGNVLGRELGCANVFKFNGKEFPITTKE